MNWLKKLFTKIEQQIEPTSKSKQHVKQALYATIIRACSNCGAAGVDETGKDVGPKCPNCGAKRPTNEDKGRIWFKER